MTVKLHDAFGARVEPVQASPTRVKLVSSLCKATVSVVEVAVPVFRTVNGCGLPPTVLVETFPKSKIGVQLLGPLGVGEQFTPPGWVIVKLTAGAALLPDSATDAFAAGLLLVAESVAVSVSPADVNAYVTDTLHDLPLPRLVPEHRSLLSVKPADPVAIVSAIFSADVAVPPELVSVKVCGCESPL